VAEGDHGIHEGGAPHQNANSLPWLAWQGWCVVALVALLVTEIILTLWDFVVEDLVRKQLGGVYPGERVMHGVMGIVYGAAIACLVPTLVTWWLKPTGLAISVPAVSIILRWTLTIMAVGVLLSGLRDLCSAVGVNGSAWPWK
jgi:hypothetical protein